MNYQKIYDSIIEKRKNEVPTGYTETHHIIPVSFGGDNSKSNLVKLTAREHFICHFLLLKINIKTSFFYKALNAFMMMSVSSENQDRIITSRLYDKYRSEYAKMISVLQTGCSNCNYGKCWISHLEFKISKMIKRELYPEYYEQGWVLGNRKWNSLRYHKVKKTRPSKIENEVKRLWKIFIEGDYKSITEFKELINYPYSVINLRSSFEKYIPEYKSIMSMGKAVSSERVRKFYKESEDLN